MCDDMKKKPVDEVRKPGSKGVPSPEVGRGPGADPYSPPEDDRDDELVDERQHRVIRLAPVEKDDLEEEERPGPRGRKEPPRREPPEMGRTPLPPPVKDVPVPPLPGGQTQLDP